jgi:hypothetical protein
VYLALSQEGVVFSPAKNGDGQDDGVGAGGEVSVYFFGF